MRNKINFVFKTADLNIQIVTVTKAALLSRRCSKTSKSSKFNHKFKKHYKRQKAVQSNSVQYWQSLYATRVKSLKSKFNNVQLSREFIWLKKMQNFASTHILVVLTFNNEKQAVFALQELNIVKIRCFIAKFNDIKLTIQCAKC